MIKAMPISHYRTDPVKLMAHHAVYGSLLMRAAAMDAGYCLDAPDEMPAGSCYWVSVDEDGFPEQATVWREE